MRILVVDDNKSTAMVTAGIAENYGAEVDMAHSGETALDILKKQQYDLVLMDVVMPGMDGYETTREIRRQHSDRWFPIIFLTALDDDIEQGINSGGDDYLIKPITEPILIAKIRAMNRIFDMQSKLIELSEELSKAAATDPLTKLLNRRAFNEYLEKQWMNGRRFKTPEKISIIMMDIDHFKRYNDNYGHLKGDECIKSIARILSNEIFRPMDAVARFGGEEFIAVLPNTDLIGARTIAERIRSNVENAKILHVKSSTAPVITLSIGVSSTSEFEKGNYVDLIHCADRALYNAKQRGRNRVCTEYLSDPYKVMVVDDDPSSRDFISKIISPIAEVIAVNSGKDCLEVAAIKRPDLILLDVIMPDMDGFEVCEKLKAAEDSSFIPVMLVSAADKAKVVGQAKICGANGVIQKPVDENDFVRKVKSFLQ